MTLLKGEEAMKNLQIILGSLVFGIVISAGGAALADEDAAASLAKAPAAVQATAKKELGEKKLEEFDKEIVGGKVEYEVGYSEKGVDHAIIVAEDGSVIQHEADVEVDKLPKPVTDAVTKAHVDGKITEAANATSPDGKTYFDVDVKVGDEMHAMDINADGTVISDEISKSASDEKSEAKDEDKKDDKKI
jgi:hypothetical protein